jgi:hypothetical protein
MSIIPTGFTFALATKRKLIGVDRSSTFSTTSKIYILVLQVLLVTLASKMPEEEDNRCTYPARFLISWFWKRFGPMVREMEK